MLSRVTSARLSVSVIAMFSFIPSAFQTRICMSGHSESSSLKAMDTIVAEAKAIYAESKPVLSFFARINRYSAQLEDRAFDANFRREVSIYSEKLTQLLLRLDAIPAESEDNREHRKKAVQTVQRLIALSDMIVRDVFVFIDRQAPRAPAVTV